MVVMASRPMIPHRCGMAPALAVGTISCDNTLRSLLCVILLVVVISESLSQSGEHFPLRHSVLALSEYVMINLSLQKLESSIGTIRSLFFAKWRLKQRDMPDMLRLSCINSLHKSHTHTLVPYRIYNVL